MPLLVIFQDKTEQFDDRKDAEKLVSLLRSGGIEYEYTASAGKAQPKRHKCKNCDTLHYTYYQATDCCEDLLTED